MPGVSRERSAFAVRQEGAATLEGPAISPPENVLYAGTRAGAVIPPPRHVRCSAGTRFASCRDAGRARSLEADIAFRDEASAGVARAAGSK